MTILADPLQGVAINAIIQLFFRMNKELLLTLLVLETYLVESATIR